MNSQNDVMEHTLKLFRMFRRHPAGSHRISHGGYRIANAVIENNGIRTTDLAKELDVRSASLSNALKRLEAKGYLCRKQDANDLRTIRLYATEKARREHAEWVAQSHTYKDRMAKCITEEECEIFCNICDKLCTFFESEFEEDTELKEATSA